MNFTPVSQAQGPVDGYPSPAAPSQTATKDTFLQLLVAQIKNQNPLNPADGTQFLTQLAQFTELEQMVAIRDEVTALRKQNEALATKNAELAGNTSGQESTETSGEKNV
ncbi:MAG TPA: flagellar hook capping FlgD N-terminal domain-containing protein [Bryobacteraceae bacterium]|nr:flagellar hook capping FlgD N-terminal domain-containing protein [Bryobacteraceae bacterium]